MLKKRFISLVLVAAISFMSGLSIVLASGAVEVFDDVSYDDWYGESVYSLYRMGVVEGVDGSYMPDSDVNRAEMAIMLDRLYDYMLYPQGTDWEVIEVEDEYTVWYPEDMWTPIDDCNSGLMGEGDFIWSITCKDSGDTAVGDYIDAYYSNVDDDEKSETAQELTINGHAATLYTVDVMGSPASGSQVVIIEDGASDTYYVLSGPANDLAFEYFYRSFRLE